MDCIFSLFNHLCFCKTGSDFFKENGSFCPKYVLPNWDRCPQFETLHSEKIHSILNQPFFYLTKGKQSFVFISKDQQWVLKLIRLPRYVMRYSRKGKASSLSFLSKTLLSFKMAYEQLPEETGIVYAHLKPMSLFEQKIKFVDQLGKVHLLDLNDFPFVIQKHGTALFSVFDNLEDPKEMIQKIVHLFSNLYEKGFIDRDPIFDKNFGVINDHPFIIDVGQIEKISLLPSRSDFLHEMTQSLGGKLQRESPELYSYYKKLLL